MSFEIDRIAELANLRLNDSEKQAVEAKMKGIVKFVETITNLDLQDCPEAVSSYEMPTVLREDVPGVTLTQEDLLINVPKMDDSFIIVPQVIQK